MNCDLIINNIFGIVIDRTLNERNANPVPMKSCMGNHWYSEIIPIPVTSLPHIQEVTWICPKHEIPGLSCLCFCVFHLRLYGMFLCICRATEDIRSQQKWGRKTAEFIDRFVQLFGLFTDTLMVEPHFMMHRQHSHLAIRILYI